MNFKDSLFHVGTIFACVLMLTTWRQHCRISQIEARIAQLETRDTVHYGEKGEPCSRDWDCKNALSCFCAYADFDWANEKYPDGCQKVCSDGVKYGEDDW